MDTADGAITRLREAVAAEDSLQYQEPPDWSFPSRHELGALQLKAGHVQQAEITFSEDLVYWPENGYALQGLRTALIRQGREAEAAALDERVAKAWQFADGTMKARRAEAR